MATKTISIDMEAYETLRRARTRPDESFSRVIKRARWDRPPSTARTLLERLSEAPVPDEETLDYWEQAQAHDEAPEHAWTE